MCTCRAIQRWSELVEYLQVVVFKGDRLTQRGIMERNTPCKALFDGIAKKEPRIKEGKNTA